MTFDYKVGRLLLDGGGTFFNMGATYTDKAWTWDGRNWQPVIGYGGSGGFDHTLASSPTLGTYRLRGDRAQVPGTNQWRDSTATVWLSWADKAWLKTTIDGPPFRAEGSLTYDPNLKAFLYFGGSLGSSGCDSNTNRPWSTDGKKWTAIDTSGPSPCGGIGAMAYDQASNSMIWVGHDGTWSWNETRWKQLASERNSPPWGTFATLAYDPKHRQLLLVGMMQGDGFGYTYVWNGTRWGAF
jgi:hypothetical protein